MKSIVTTLLFAAAAGCAAAADLELFNLKLADAAADQVRAAAVAAGARATVTKGPLTTLDATRIGLPGARTLELTAIDGKVMTAQYFFGQDSYATDETLRKMLLAKYGAPQQVKVGGFAHPVDFAAQYVSDGSYAWNFERDMQLVYRREFFGEVYLSYVNRKLLAAVEAATQRRDDGTVKHQAKSKGSVF